MQFTATLPNVYNPFPQGQTFPNARFTGRANQETSMAMYLRYREMALGLIDTNSPEIFYRAFNNDPDSSNGEGLHEKFIYRGQSILDISVGMLDYPWFSADGNPTQEITQHQLQLLANAETVPVVAWRLRAIANFAANLPMYTRYYHYVGLDGVRAITIEDEFNAVKFACVLTFVSEA